MIKQMAWPIALLLILILTSLACAFIPNNDESKSETVTPTASDVLTYLVPLYGTTLEPGESVAGTQMTYVGRDQDIFNVTIDGLSAAKRSGDSFIWKGVVAPGVVARYNLRLTTTIINQNMLVAGPVELSVLSPSPKELEDTSRTESARLHYKNIAVDHTVTTAGKIPGTSLVFEGQTEQGAQLSGTGGYPYRALGDSLIWIGQIRTNVIIRYSMRVAGLDTDRLHVLGTAELWILQE